jgi:hypothetical protein
MNPSDSDMPWLNREDEKPSREVFAAEMVEVPRTGARNDLTEMLADAIQGALASINRERAAEGKDALPSQLTPALVSVTRTALGAIEGTLKGKSLEGALKEAQILAYYAEIRERNANAARAEAETEQIHINAALENLERVLRLVKELGVEVKMVLLPNARWGVTFGDQLAAELPGLPFSAGSGAPATQSGEAAVERTE